MKSQKDKVLARLKSGQSITQLQAFNIFGCMRLGAVIYELRQHFREKYGDEYIITEMVPVKNRYGKKVYVARYLL